DGTRVKEPHEVSEVIVAFYQNLLGQQPTGESLDMNLLRKALPKSISAVQNENLDRDVSFEEIKEVLFPLKDNKAPGPDGFNAGFFKRTWNIVKNDVLCAIKSFFDSGKLLKQVNATTITLVPKVPNPSQVKEFKPISCCNTIYKYIAKLIANRVKMVLPNIVGPQQTPFVKGRHISDNILLSQELLRNYHRRGGLPRCALKVDLMKATILFRVVRWITEYVTTTRFSIFINRELHGFFASGRGLRQGDPLSPYLFVLAMEVFSGLMGLMVAEQDFKYHWRCEKEKITHLCFADDLMVFCRAEVGSVSIIGECLNRFKALSGLIPNPDKSNLFANCVSTYLKDQLLDVLGYKEGVLP
ncbi:Hypothetical predicted protein, partial [Olea europaea subsp. europaea]